MGAGLHKKEEKYLPPHVPANVERGQADGGKGAATLNISTIKNTNNKHQSDGYLVLFVCNVIMYICY